MSTLKNNNARLTSALQESTANVEEWKRQLHSYKEENTRLKVGLIELEAGRGKKRQQHLICVCDSGNCIIIIAIIIVIMFLCYAQLPSTFGAGCSIARTRTRLDNNMFAFGNTSCLCSHILYCKIMMLGTNAVH